MPPTTANAEELALLLVDVQPRFLETMHGDSQPLLARIEQLLIVAEWFLLPVLASFEHPVEQKGRLPESLQQVFPESGRTFLKQTFDLCGQPEMMDALTALGRRQLAVSGAETDVCVLQSVLGLLSCGYEVFLLEDCLLSSESRPGPALRRMYAAGAVPCTYKMLLYYELLGTVDPARWDDEHRRAVQNGFVSPESLSLPPSVGGNA